MDYEKQASDLAAKLGLELIINKVEHRKHFLDDTDSRDVYNVTLKRGSRSYTFDFGQSINCSGKYIGHKRLCLNNFKQYLFSEEDIKKWKLDGWWCKKTYEIKKNPNYKEPGFYDILCCLTKYDPGDFNNFCDDYGYSNDSIKALKTYEAVTTEFVAMQSLFSDEELELLTEIQ